MCVCEKYICIYICTYYPADTEWGQHPRPTKTLVLSRIEVIRDHRKVPANSIAFPYLVSKWSTWRKRGTLKRAPYLLSSLPSWQALGIRCGLGFGV